MKVYVIISERQEHEYGYGGWTGDVNTITNIVSAYASEERVKTEIQILRDKRRNKESNYRDDPIEYHYIELYVE